MGQIFVVCCSSTGSMHPIMEGVSLGGVVAKPAPGKKLICWEQRWPQMPKPLAGWLRFSLKRLKKKGFFLAKSLGGGGEGKNVGNPPPPSSPTLCAPWLPWGNPIPMDFGNFGTRGLKTPKARGFNLIWCLSLFGMGLLGGGGLGWGGLGEWVWESGSWGGGGGGCLGGWLGKGPCPWEFYLVLIPWRSPEKVEGCFGL